MSIKRGIVTEITSSSARPIAITSTLPVALVLSSSVVPNGLHQFESPKKAIEFFKENHNLDEDDGNLIKYLSIGYDMFNLTVPTIVRVVNLNVVDDDPSDEVGVDSLFKAEFIKGINEFKTAPSLTGYHPDIIAVGFDSYDLDVYNAVKSVCGALKARAFLDLYATDNSDAIQKRESFGSERLTVAKSSVEIFNVLTAQKEGYDSGIILAFLRSFVDGESKTGYAKSISNRTLAISGVESPSEFYAGAIDETDPLTEKQIMSFIHYKGFRTWEYATTSADAIWQDARRVRIFDLAAQAVIDGIFFAVDKDLSALASAKDSLRGFMNGLIGDDVMLGFNIELDMERTTKERITAGEFFFIIDCQEVPSPKLICVTFNRVDTYADVVYELINKA